MIKSIISNRLAAFQRDLGYDVTYIRDVLDADLTAFMRVAHFSKFSAYCRDLSPEVWHASKVAGALCSDCGPCAQLVVTMAERAKVSPDTLRAVVRGDDAALSPDVRLGVSFVRAVMERDPSADTLREQVVARWGRRALVSLAFAAVSARIYPTLKFALGHARSCTRVVVAGTPVTPKPPEGAPIGVTA